MHLSTIRYIVTIASFGSFTKAAEALFITQPALSQAVRRYEEELHTPIFIRTRSGLELPKRVKSSSKTANAFWSWKQALKGSFRSSSRHRR